MFYEEWIRARCSNCQKWNWFYITHSQRAYPSGPDLFAIKCWSCNHCEWLDEVCKEQATIMYGEEPIEEIAIIGTREP